jgi:type II secretory pathway pseudopilin PulG
MVVLSCSNSYRDDQQGASKHQTPGVTMSYPPPPPPRTQSRTNWAKVALITVGVLAAMVMVIVVVSMMMTAATPSAGPASAATTSSAAPAATKATDKFTAWMKLHYGTARWLKNITGHHEAGGVLSVDTNVNAPTSKGMKICQAISHYQVANGGFTGVRVYAADGTHLAQRLSITDPC